MFEWGTKYGLYKLLEYSRQLKAKGESPVSEKMKAAMLQTFEKETDLMVKQDWSKIPVKDRWRAGVHDIFNKRSPDAREQKDHIGHLQHRVGSERDGKS